MTVAIAPVVLGTIFVALSMLILAWGSPRLPNGRG
jgi:hypothetical protein